MNPQLSKSSLAALALLSAGLFTLGCGGSAEEDTDGMGGESSATGGATATSAGGSPSASGGSVEEGSGGSTEVGSGGGNWLGIMTDNACLQGSASGTGCAAADECVAQNCESSFESCFGEDYKSGTFTGQCESYLGCVSACDTNGTCDETCTTQCATDDACTSCLQNSLATCLQVSCSNALLSCLGGEGGIDLGDGTCEDLQACCESLAGDEAAACDSALAAASSAGDAACSALLTGFQSGGFCE